MVKFLDEALKVYQNNNKVLPEQIVIYRDGIGGPLLMQKAKEKEINAVIALI